MSIQSIDVARETTLQKIYDKVEEGAGIWCEPEYRENQTIGGNYADGTLGNTTEGVIVLNFKNKICVLMDNSKYLMVKNGLTKTWESLCELPFVADVHETSFIIFHDEIHMLGGRDDKVRSHYKYDGTKWSVASELPYDFCNGKVIVYQDRLHIIGGGPTGFYTTYGTGRLNNHYSWDGETWKKASDLPYISWGCTPFVCGGKLHIIGGGIVSDVNYNQTHYSWDGISWSKETDIPFKMFNGSVAYISDKQVYIIGGMENSGGNRQNLVKIYNGESWLDTANLPTDALNNSSCAACVNSDRQVVVMGRRMFTLINGSYVGFGSMNNSVVGGDALVYKNELHLFTGRSHLKWTMDGWVKVSTIPYSFTGGSAIIYKDKIHLLGSSSPGMEDYHYSWSPEEGWVLKSNLPGKLVNGSAVVLGDEIHIIGGTDLNGKTYNHYKLKDARWEPVGHTIGGLLGAQSAVSYNGKIYAATQVADNGGTIYDCNITVFDGTGWSSLGTVSTGITSSNIKALLVFKNRLHLLVKGAGTFEHYIFTSMDKSIGHTIKGKEFYVPDDPLAVVYGNRIYVLSEPSGERDSIVYCEYSYIDVPTMNIFLPKNHQIICDKSEILPVVGNIKETDTGYMALETDLYTFVNYADKFSVS